MRRCEALALFWLRGPLGRLSLRVMTTSDCRQFFRSVRMRMSAIASIGALLVAVVGMAGCQPSGPGSHRTQFVFVRIPEQLTPIETGAKYQDPLNAALKREGVGRVSGGGSELSAIGGNGRKSIDWAGVDVELSDFGRGLPILKRELLRLGAPPTTILQYSQDGKQVEERLR
jgi:hypothetical protein